MAEKLSDRVLYREWRPLDFDQVVGQLHVVSSLRQSATSGSIAHAYLFSGTRGTGKTSLAKIYARAINCPNVTATGNPCNECEICTTSIRGSLLDIIEMDAASNNSVDDIRKLTDEVLFLPTLTKYKVYIIDEVHMLSTSAFNALLKTLEEPPAHAVFILATTDPQRIPATILSRVQRYDFKRIRPEDMVTRLRLIADSSDIAIDDDALKTIVSYAEGALRDAISLLDQARSIYKGHITREDVLNMTGVVSDDFMVQIISALVNGNVDALIETIDELIMQGGDITRFTSSLAQYMRNLLVYKTSSHPERLLQVPQDTLNGLAVLAPLYTSKELIEQISYLAKLQLELKQSENPRITLEVGLIQLLQNIKQDEVVNIEHAPMAKASPAVQLTQNKTPKPQPEVEPEPASPVEEPVIEPEREPTPEIKPKPETPIEEPEVPEPAEPEEPEEPARPDRPDRPETPDEPETPKPERPEVPSPQVTPTETTMPAPPVEMPELGSGAEVVGTGSSMPEIPNEIPKTNSTSGLDAFMDLTSILQSKEQDDVVVPKEQDDLIVQAETDFVAEPILDAIPEREVALHQEEAPEVNRVIDVDINELWNKFISKLNEEDPLSAILLNSCTYYIDGNEFVIEFAREQSKIYDKLKSAQQLIELRKNFNAISEGSGLGLVLALEGEADRSDEVEVRTEPEWVQRMRAAAQELNVPMTDDRNS